VPRTRLLALFVVLAAVFLVPVGLTAGSVTHLGSAPDVGSGQPTHEGLGAWFVQLKSPPTVDGGSAGTIAAEQQKFRADATAKGIKFTSRYSFQKLWNGVSIDVGTNQLDLVLGLPNVTAVYPVGTVSIPRTESTADPELATALAMTGADIAQTELGLTGEGVKVAVMDTGIDYDHPDLGGCFGAGCRVAAGWDLVGDSYNADPSSPAYQPVPNPDADPDDCNGHGTHVSGIVGAEGDVTGVAPGVTFGAYRVFGCAGSTTDEVMIEAMERAYADDMDILNMSIGDAFNNWHQSPTGQASTNLVKAGVVVVASIGNSGANGVWSGGVPGMGTKVIGVASYDNSHVALNQFTISPDDTAIGYQPMTGAPLPPTSGSLPMGRTGTPATTNDACSPLTPGSLTGMAALIRRGTCSFLIKATNALNAGAAAVVIYNNAAGRFAGTVAPGPMPIPVVSISDAEGVLINNRLAVGAVTMTWDDESGAFSNPTGGLISSFSSYGLEAELDLKPDIGAPGGLIRSTYPLELGGYATISGTSMASPHVAGGAALLLQSRPNLNASGVANILQNHADPANWSLNPGLGFLDSVHRQGAGMLDIDDAILAAAEVSPGKLALGEGESGPIKKTLEITNRAKTPVTYDLSYESAIATGPPTNAPNYFLSDESVAFSSPSVTVGAQGKERFDVTVTPATGPTQGVYGGYIVLTPQNGGQVLRVPYAGFVGDYQSVVAMTPTSFNFPWVSRLTTCTIVRGLECTAGGVFTNSPGATFTMTNAFNVPQLLIHFEHQVARLQVLVKNAATGQSHQLAFDMQYLSRSATSTGFASFPFSGQTASKNGQQTFTVPNGTYVFEISALKAGGNPRLKAHWETKTSAPFTIARP
jgi:subtilisin family serine protease